VIKYNLHLDIHSSGKTVENKEITWKHLAPDVDLMVHTSLTYNISVFRDAYSPPGTSPAHLKKELNERLYPDPFRK
jgi:hypothetical protein